MKKSIFLKLLVLAVCAAMLLSLFACDGGKKNEETQKPTTNVTEKPTEAPDTDPETPTDPVDPETDPVDPETDPVDPETDPEDPTDPETPTDPEDPTDPETPTDPEDPKPECDKNHPIKAKGDQGHYEDACEICGTDRGTPVPHTYETVEGKPTCSVCGYVASCQGVHAMQKDETGHWTDSCYICGAAAIEKAEHTAATVEGKYICTVCGIELACPEKHAVSSDAEGHWFAACDVCGAAATEKVPHSEEKAEFVTDTAYVYGCADCGYAVYSKAITEGVKAFFEAGLFNKADNFYNLGAHKFIYDTETYSRYNGNDAVAQALWQRAHEDMVWNQFASEGQQKKVDIGNAKYLVLKIRTNAPAEVVKLQFSTTGANSPTKVATEQMVCKKGGNDFVVAEIGEEYRTSAGYSGIVLPLAASESGEWATYVIDLEKAFPTQMVKDAETGTYIVDTFYFDFNSIAAATNFDVAYAAYVDGDWSAVDAFVDEETAVLVTASGIGSVVKTENAQCIGDHAYTLKVVDGVYQSVCACGDIAHNYNVKADAVNKFFGAEIIVGKGGMNGKMDLTLTYDETDAFVRIDNCVVNKDNWFGFTPVTWESGNFGQYMVMKFRIGENGLNQSFLQIYTHSVASKDAGINWPSGNLKFRVVEDNQWHYIVIDMAACVPADAWQADANGNYAPNYFQFRPFASNQKGAQADDYMDIAYIAFFDSLDDIKDIVDAETYEWCIDSSTNALRNTADNSCAQHAIAELVDGTTHTIKCTLCGEVIRTFEVSADINWYSTLSGMGKMQHSLDKMLFDEEEGVMFNRYTGTGGNHLNLSSTAGGAGAPTSTAFASGKYVAIKYRATNTTIGLSVATYAPDFEYKDNRGKSVGTQSIANLPGDEWRVAIVDVSGVTGWTSDGSQQRFYLMITTGGSQPYTVDIAWVAVVDSIDEMKLLLQEGETYVDMGSNWANTPVEYNQDGTKVPCKEGTCVAAEPTISTDESGATVYTYACAKCEKVISTKVVPASVAAYNTPAYLANGAAFYFSATGNGAKSIAASEDLVYAAFNNYRQLIYFRHSRDMGGAQEAAANQNGSMNVGNAKYAVIKLRSSDAAAWLSLSLSTEGKTGGTTVAEQNMPEHHKIDGSYDTWTEGETEVKGVLAGNEYVNVSGYTSVSLLKKGAATGEWVTCVIDLAAVYGDVYAKAEGAEDYVLDYLVVDLEGAIDIAYLAFVEGEWADVDALVDEETVHYVKTLDGAYDEYKADGTKLTYSVPEANAAAKGTQVKVTGTVTKINTAYSEQFGNITLTLTDNNGNSLYCYRLKGNWALGDIITVTGTMDVYNGAPQLAAGGTAEKIGTHTTHVWKDATCTEPKSCILCDATEGEAAGHSYVEGVCSVCGEKEPAAGDTVATVSMSDVATANGWADATLYASFNLNDDVVVASSGTPVGNYGLNTGKYYVSGGTWRIYQNETPSVTITAAGKTIVSVKITYSVKNSGTLTLNGENIASATVVEVNAESVTFGVGNTGDKTNGQAQITAIEVIYR